MLALIVLLAVTTGIGVSLGVTPAVLLPQWFGAVRTLIGVIGVVAGGAVGLWAAGVVTHVLADGVRWAVSSRAVGALAPTGRFFRRRERSRVWSLAGSLAMTALIPALGYWGPGAGLASLAHGFRDAALVAELRAQGARTHGELIDVPSYSTDDNGNTATTVFEEAPLAVATVPKRAKPTKTVTFNFSGFISGQPTRARQPGPQQAGQTPGRR